MSWMKEGRFEMLYRILMCGCVWVVKEVFSDTRKLDLKTKIVEGFPTIKFIYRLSCLSNVGVLYTQYFFSSLDNGKSK